MAAKLESLRANMQRQNDGDWIPIPELTDPITGEIVELRVRGFSYGKYQAALSDTRQRWVRRYGSLDATPADVITRAIGRLYAEHLLLSWRGFDQGYDAKIAEDLLTSPGDFFGYVSVAVQEVSRTEAAFTEDAAKN